MLGVAHLTRFFFLVFFFGWGRETLYLTTPIFNPYYLNVHDYLIVYILHPNQQRSHACMYMNLILVKFHFKHENTWGGVSYPASIISVIDHDRQRTRYSTWVWSQTHHIGTHGSNCEILSSQYQCFPTSPRAS